MNHDPGRNPASPAAPTPATLGNALRLAADDLQQLQPPPELQARVLAAAHVAATTAAPAVAAGAWQRHPVAAGAPTPAAPHRSGWWAWSGAAACAAVIAGSALLMLLVPPPSPVDDGIRIGADRGFLPLVPPERWPPEAVPAWLVSTELPGERLAALGLPYDPARAGESVRAELLLHPSGEVLAVRFLH